jgi:hypothetical protein
MRVDGVRWPLTRRCVDFEATLWIEGDRVMSHRFTAVQLLALLCVLGLGTSSAFALGIDVPKPKKEKKEKKEEKKEASKSEEKKGDGEAKSTPPAEGAKTADLWAEVKKDVEPLVDKTMEGYNNKDWNAFFAQFAKDAQEQKEALSMGYGMFRDNWGAYKSRALSEDKQRSNPDYFSFGKLSYDVQFQNQKARMDINFKKLDGKFVLLALSFLNTDGSFAQPGVSTQTAGGGKTMTMNAPDMKLPKSAWDKMGDSIYKAGDWVEYEYPQVAGMTTRMECLEVGDHFVVLKTASTVAGQTTISTGKMIYSEPDPEVKDVEQEKHKMETKEYSDKVDVKDKGNVAATRYETFMDGKLMAKSWVSKEVPMGGMVRAEDADGKVSMQLKAYGKK